MNKPIVCFYGTFASYTKRELEKLARASRYAVASTLRDALDLVVLGEGEPLAQTRAQLALEFDETSRVAFETGKLESISETEFLRRLSETPIATRGYTPAAIAELVGVSVATTRRWYKRGLLEPSDRASRLPLFSTRQVLAAKRLAFLFSTGLSEDFIEKRLFAFYEKASRESKSTIREEEDENRLPLFSYESADENEKLTLADVVLQTTLANDGRDLLYLGKLGPSDLRGQRRFDFAALPTDGSFEKPQAAELTSEEEQIALADKLIAWNAETTNANGRPAFLELFDPESRLDEKTTDESLEFVRENALDPDRLDAPSDATSLVALCQRAWNLEREGYWEEAERVYRSAALSGAREPAISFRLGKLLRLQEDYSAARERFYAALELDPDYAEARFELAETFVALGNFDDALEQFAILQNARPVDARLRLELGKLYLRLERRDDAQREFQNVAELVDDARLADDLRKIASALASTNARSLANVDES